MVTPVSACLPSLQILEDRLSKKKEALLEKQLLFEEVASLTQKLRKQATEGRAEALELSKKAGLNRMQRPRTAIRAFTR